MKLAETFKCLQISKITLSKTITLATIVILLSYCRKIDKSENLNTKDPISEETVPSSIPTISSNVQLYSQLNHIASFMASFIDNTSINVWGPDNMMNTLCQNIPTNEDNVPIMTYHNLVATNTSGVNFKFSINGASPSNPNSNDLYDALVYSKNSTTISPAINPVWDPNFYGYFNIGANEYYTLLRIPEF